jgi:hypothetical protein
VLAFSSDGKLLGSTNTNTGEDTLEAQQAKLEALKREIGEREERLRRLARDQELELGLEGVSGEKKEVR